MHKLRCFGKCGAGRCRFAPLKDHDIFYHDYSGAHAGMPVEFRYSISKCKTCGNEMMTEEQQKDFKDELNFQREMIDLGATTV